MTSVSYLSAIKYFTRFFLVGIKLLLQQLRGVEKQLGAYPLNESDFYLLAIDASGEIEDIRLYRIRLAVECRPETNVCHRFVFIPIGCCRQCRIHSC